MTFSEYLEEVRYRHAKNPDWRAGQTYFNVLTTSRSHIAEEIRGTMFDPFYDNSVIPEFLAMVFARW